MTTIRRAVDNSVTAKMVFQKFDEVKETITGLTQDQIKFLNNEIRRKLKFAWISKTNKNDMHPSSYQRDFKGISSTHYKTLIRYIKVIAKMYPDQTLKFIENLSKDGWEHVLRKSKIVKDLRAGLGKKEDYSQYRLEIALEKIQNDYEALIDTMAPLRDKFVEALEIKDSSRIDRSLINAAIEQMIMTIDLRKYDIDATKLTKNKIQKVKAKIAHVIEEL